MDVLRVTEHVARKRYRCDACVWIYESEVWRDEKLTYAELRAIAKARRNHWRIMPGQKYIKQISVDGGQLLVWRGIPEIHEICLRYDIYDYP